MLRKRKSNLCWQRRGNRTRADVNIVNQAIGTAGCSVAKCHGIGLQIEDNFSPLVVDNWVKSRLV